MPARDLAVGDKVRLNERGKETVRTDYESIGLSIDEDALNNTVGTVVDESITPGMVWVHFPTLNPDVGVDGNWPLFDSEVDLVEEGETDAC